MEQAKGSLLSLSCTLFQSKRCAHLAVNMQFNPQTSMLFSYSDDGRDDGEKFNHSAAGSNIGESNFIWKSCYIIILTTVLQL